MNENNVNGANIVNGPNTVPPEKTVEISNVENTVSASSEVTEPVQVETANEQPIEELVVSAQPEVTEQVSTESVVEEVTPAETPATITADISVTEQPVAEQTNTEPTIEPVSQSVTPVVPESTVPVNNNTSTDTKKKGKGIIVLFIILGILVVGVAGYFISKALNKFDDPFKDNDRLFGSSSIIINHDYEKETTVLDTLNTQLENGTIDKDKYMQELTDFVFGDKEHDLDSIVAYETFMDSFEKYYDDLSDELKVAIWNKITLSDTKWGNEEVSYNNSNNNIILLANKDSDVAKLDEVKLSENGNFLIYYTKSGKNAVTDEFVNTVSESLEDTIKKYKETFNLDYKYSIIYNIGVNTELNAIKLLEKNNIDRNYISTAMPVYITTVNDNVLGFYNPANSSIVSRYNEISLKLGHSLNAYTGSTEVAATTYAFPYFAISSGVDNIVDLKEVMSHELMHHYEYYIAGNGEYGEYIINLFTNETVANWASAKINDITENDTLFSHYSKWYIKNTETAMDKTGDTHYGYAQLPFLKTYEDVTNVGNDVILKSILSGNRPLEYLQENSNGKYKEVMTTLAARNLTLDYDKKLYTADLADGIIYPKNHKNIAKTDTISEEVTEPSSMHYYYINPSQYGIKSQLIFNSLKEQSLMLLVLDGGQYKPLATYDFQDDFVINIGDFISYDELVIVIVNSYPAVDGKYTYQYLENGGKTVSYDSSSLNLKTLSNAVNDVECYQVETDEDTRTVFQYGLSFDDGKLSTMYFKGTIQMLDYDENNPAYRIARGVAKAGVWAMRAQYKKEFKRYKFFTIDEGDKIGVLFKITKNPFEALKAEFNGIEDNKDSIINAIRNEGYTCTVSGSSSSTNTNNKSKTSNKPNTPTTFSDSNNSDSVILSTGGESYKGIVYLDPTDINASCDEKKAKSNVNSQGKYTGVKKGCMKFYIFDDSGDSYKLLLDHDITGCVQWNSEGTAFQENTEEGNFKGKDMKEIKERLEIDTEGWVGNPRLITADEIAAIVGNTSWSTDKATSIDSLEFRDSDYSWLYDNLYNLNLDSGNNNQDYYCSDPNSFPITSYWTSSPTHGEISSYSWGGAYWAVSDGGYLTPKIPAQYSAIRPVITIPKSYVNN